MVKVVAGQDQEVVDVVEVNLGQDLIQIHLDQLITVLMVPVQMQEDLGVAINH